MITYLFILEDRFNHMRCSFFVQMFPVLKELAYESFLTDALVQTLFSLLSEQLLRLNICHAQMEHISYSNKIQEV